MFEAVFEHTVLPTLFLSCVATGIAALTRALPWPRRWLKRKPFSCNVCLGGHGAWMALLLNWTWLGWQDTLLVYFAVTALAALALTYLFPPPVAFDGEPQ